LYAKDDAQLQIQLGSHTVRRHKAKLYLVGVAHIHDDMHIKFGDAIELAGRSLVVKERQAGIRKPHSDEIVSIRFNCLNERIHLAHKPGTNTIKHWLKDAGIPAWERHCVPVVFYNDTPVQVVGIGFAKQLSERPGVAWCFD
jgi:tRNA(Ile)-lysidine synthase